MIDWGRDRRGWIQGKRKGFPEWKEEEEQTRHVEIPPPKKMKMAQRPTIYSISRSKSARYRLNFLYFAEVGYLLAFFALPAKKGAFRGDQSQTNTRRGRGKNLRRCDFCSFSSSSFPPPISPTFMGTSFFPIFSPLLLLFSHDRTRHLSSLRRRLISRETAPEISPRPYSSKGVLFDCEVQSISHKKGRMWEMEALIRGI